MLEVLTYETLRSAAARFCRELSNQPIPALYGITDGKAVGTFVEVGFNNFIAENYEFRRGNAAKGIDFPSLDTDLKVTSIKQPQSSCPFRDATQKVYGLGYNLLVMVYEKRDDTAEHAATLDFKHVILIDKASTADFQLTRAIRAILDRDGNADDIDAFLEDKNLPLDFVSRRQLAERLLQEPPELGMITMSNALQWRLQYGHAIKAVVQGDPYGLEDLLA